MEDPALEILCNNWNWSTQPIKMRRAYVFSFLRYRHGDAILIGVLVCVGVCSCRAFPTTHQSRNYHGKQSTSPNAQRTMEGDQITVHSPARDSTNPKDNTCNLFGKEDRKLSTCYEIQSAGMCWKWLGQFVLQWVHLSAKCLINNMSNQCMLDLSEPCGDEQQNDYGMA